MSVDGDESEEEDDSKSEEETPKNDRGTPQEFIMISQRVFEQMRSQYFPDAPLLKDVVVSGVDVSKRKEWKDYKSLII